MKLRKDIQGLRALAVGAVVVFHLWPGWLPGGYVGVDVFFVISGYLITAHLIGEVEASGTVSITRFWARRIRRLLPASFLVLAVSFVTALLLLPRATLQEAVTAIGASALYVQNWLLAINSVDYLAADNQPTIVQHFWSLSVEEQFYLVWPILIVIVAWVATRALGPSSRRAAIGWVLLAVFVASLAISIYLTAESQPFAYFATPTRVWEFAAGGLLVWAPRLFTRGTRADTVMTASLSWAGIALVAVAFFVLDGSSPFPGWIALIPVIGTALLLYADGQPTPWTPQFLAAARPIQFLGDVSYSVYLWHWPLIIAYPYIFGAAPGLVAKLAIVVCTVGLAWATKVWVEDPVRRGNALVRRRSVAFGFMAAGMAALLVVTISTVNRINTENEEVAAALAADLERGCTGAAAVAPDADCELPYAVTATVDPAFSAEDYYWIKGIASKSDCELSDGAAHCELGDTSEPILTIALVGDSHAEHMLDPLVSYATAQGWRVLTYTKACNSFEFLTPEDHADGDDRESCVAWSERTFGELRDRGDIDVVLYSIRAKTKPAQVDKVVEAWETLRGAGKAVVALRDVPGMPAGLSAPVCVEMAGDQYDPCTWSTTVEPDFITEAVAASNGAVDFIDFTDFFCTDDLSLGDRRHDRLLRRQSPHLFVRADAHALPG